MTITTAAYRGRLGIEIEMVVAHAATGASLPVRAYFQALEKIKMRRGMACERIDLDGRCVGLHTVAAACGLDNGFNLLETSLAPVDAGRGGLGALADAAHQELADSIEALAVDDAVVLNVSEHPACPRDLRWYESMCVPRPIYEELRGYRGWHHWEGIDAKAQNGANTSVPVVKAAQALNVAIALAPASIALFANSPLEAGRETGFKENRMTLWPRVFGPARFSGDLRLSRYPERPFADLGDFFRWMFGPGTVTRGLPPMPSHDYKSAATVIPDGDPCLADFLRAREWRGRRTDTGEPVVLRPDARHFEYSQIGQFLDARLRYRWNHAPALPDLLAGWERDGGLEDLFETCGADVYIEARAPGAGFADACLLREAGRAVAFSLLPAPTALQAGLLANLREASLLVEEWGWERLGQLRETAMRAGLEDPSVRALCAEVLAIARAGLAGRDRHWLAYPEFVLDSGRTGADRLLDTWHGAKGGCGRRLAALLRRHTALHPGLYGEEPASRYCVD